MKKVLVLGSGKIASPLVRYLVDNYFEVTVASKNTERAEAICKAIGRATAVYCLSDDDAKLNDLVSSHDLVVCLLPAQYHLNIAQKCVDTKTHMVNPWFATEEIKQLDESAKANGVLLLNECGFDPGLDHMSAQRVIDTVHGFGGKVESLQTAAGALPTPEFADQNPFHYKFSWNTRGVLQSSNTNAYYLKDGQKVAVESHAFYENTLKKVYPYIGELEIYPNRNALEYIDIYGIPEAKTLYRGTFRYPGWIAILHQLEILGFFDESPRSFSEKTLTELLCHLLDCDASGLKEAVLAKLQVEAKAPVMDALDYLGFFSHAPLPEDAISLYKVLAKTMVSKMSLTPEEKDMCILLHIFKATYPDGHEEVIMSSLIDKSMKKGDTSIARNVAYPAACAAKLILNEEIKLSGVQIPVIPEIYNPILMELEELGIEMLEEYDLPPSSGFFNKQK